MCTHVQMAAPVFSEARSYNCLPAHQGKKGIKVEVYILVLKMKGDSIMAPRLDGSTSTSGAQSYNCLPTDQGDYKGMGVTSWLTNDSESRWQLQYF